MSLRDAAATEAAAVSNHLTLALQAELETLVRPGEAAMLVRTFEDAQTMAADLNKRASKWQVSLNDGFSDLINDVEYDVRDRIRSIGRDAEQLIDESDPVDTWETMSQWLADSFAEAIADSFVWAHERCEHVALTVAESFRLESEIRLPQVPSIDTGSMLTSVAGIDVIRTGRMTGSQKLIGAMRGSYSGILMAGIITAMAGMALINPISVFAGAVLGGFSLRQETANRLERRRNGGSKRGTACGRRNDFPRGQGDTHELDGREAPDAQRVRGGRRGVPAVTEPVGRVRQAWGWHRGRAARRTDPSPHRAPDEGAEPGRRSAGAVERTESHMRSTQ